MLDKRYLELLTAYVDGELSTRQRKHVQRLLHKSPEARKVLQQLQQNADALRRMPRHRLNPNFSLGVMQSIAERGLRPTLPRPAAAPRRFLPTWTSYAAAAAVLLAVGTISFLYFADLMPGLNQRPALVDNGNTTGSRELASTSTQDKKEPIASNDQKGRGGDHQPLVKAPVKEKEIFPERTGTTFKPRDLDQVKLREEVQKDNAVRFDLAFRNGNLTLELLQKALKAQGVTLMIDQIARARQLDGQLRSNFVLLLDDISVDDLVSLFKNLTGANNPFESMVVSNMTSKDRTNLADLMHVKADQLQPPPPMRLPSFNIGDPGSKPAGRPQEQGGDVRPEPMKSTEHLAVAMSYNPARPQSDSAEIKQFMSKRGERKPGTVQVMLVLHDVSA